MLLRFPSIIQCTIVFQGIYTADVFSKSLNYCSGVRTKNGERCFMLLCEVALGQIKEVGGDEESDSNEDDDYSKPLDFTKFQSRKGVGNTIPNPRYTITKNNGTVSQLKIQYFDIFIFSLIFSDYLIYRCSHSFGRAD